MSTVVTEKHRIDMDREMLETTMASKPNKDWRYTDQHGHIHAWVPFDKQWHLPTLKAVEDGVYEDGEPRYKLVCVECGEDVDPKYTANDERTFTAGLWDCRIDGEQVSPLEAMYTVVTGELLPPKAVEAIRTKKG